MGVAVCRERQIEILTQGDAFVVLMEDATLLKDGYDMLHKTLELTGKRFEYHEPVRCLGLKPVLQLVGNLLRRADEIPPRGRQPLSHLAKG